LVQQFVLADAASRPVTCVTNRLSPAPTQLCAHLRFVEGEVDVDLLVANGTARTHAPQRDDEQFSTQQLKTLAGVGWDNAQAFGAAIGATERCHPFEPTDGSPGAAS
jgi:hypothetical protein